MSRYDVQPHALQSKNSIFDYASALRQKWNSDKNSTWQKILEDLITDEYNYNCTTIAGIIEKFVKTCEEHVGDAQTKMNNPLGSTQSIQETFHLQFLVHFRELLHKRSELSDDQKLVFDSYLKYILRRPKNGALMQYLLLTEDYLDAWKTQTQKFKTENKREMNIQEWLQSSKDCEKYYIQACQQNSNISRLMALI